MQSPFPCYLVRRSGEGAQGSVEELSTEQLPDGGTTIEVEYSSLNFKDALACTGHPGVAPNLPHVPGIDCAGKVIESDLSGLSPGTPVLVTGYGLGAPRWGGFAGRTRVPSDWVVPLPEGLTARDAMAYGTAGFTAAQCVLAVSSRVAPADGEVLVTGATGGVGSIAAAILAKLGYAVAALTGKSDQAETLVRLGAKRVLPREELDTESNRPLLKSVWSAAVDTVGGRPLGAVIRSVRHRGVVAACGLVAGDSMEISLHPFLLRGVTLAGIDSAQCPREPRLDIWRRLAGPWRVELPPEWVTEITLDGLSDRVNRMLRGGLAGRTLVRPIRTD